jgi:RimJ/RimL family protein N-acetyltransferase
MALLIEALGAPLSSGGLQLEPLAERHRTDLAAACAEDEHIWAIYAISYAPDQFDASFDRMIATPGRIPFAIVDEGIVVGMTAFLGPDAANAVVEIGNSYIRPAARGTGLNERIKRLMLDHAFASGARRIEFRVDDRNARSKAAVAKIGGVFEGVLRADRVTWTGHIRDTALFSILVGEWPA